MTGARSGRDGTAHVALGKMVRIAPRDALDAAARAAPAAGATPVRLEPAQFAHAGRATRVVGVRFGADRTPGYVLAGVPGVWPASCLRPWRAGGGGA